MNIWSEIILPIVPLLGMLLFLILLLALLKSGYTEVVTFLFIYYVCSNSMLGYGNTVK